MNDQDPKKDNYKNDGFGHTTWVIPKRDYDFQAHEWEQRGTQLICNSCKPQHASQIPIDKMLVKRDGVYTIEPVPVLAQVSSVSCLEPTLSN